MTRFTRFLKKPLVLGVSTTMILGLAACGGNGSDANTPDWAKPVDTPGEKLTTVEVGDLEVDVYQVGVAEATRDGTFTHPDTGEYLLEKGDPVVYVNFVVTNTGDPVHLNASTINMDGRYTDWEFMQGMDASKDTEQFEEMGVTDTPLDTGEPPEPPVYTVAKGEKFSFGTNFEYRENTEIEFTASYVPVDEKGELLHDDEVKGQATTTIK